MKPTIPRPIKFILATIALCGVISGVVVFSGCSSTTGDTASYKASVATDTAVQVAMTGWGVYVANYHPGTNAEQQVYNDFEIVKDAELSLLNATASLASDPTNTAPSVAAENALGAAQSNLLSLITSLTNSVK